MKRTGFDEETSKEKKKLSSNGLPERLVASDLLWVHHWIFVLCSKSIQYLYREYSNARVRSNISNSWSTRFEPIIIVYYLTKRIDLMWVFFSGFVIQFPIMRNIHQISNHIFIWIVIVVGIMVANIYRFSTDPRRWFGIWNSIHMIVVCVWFTHISNSNMK